MEEEVAAGLEHGQRRFYKTGCRCEDCVAAEGDYQRGRRPPPTDPPVALAATPPPGDWARNGRCRTAPTTVFFPERGEDVNNARRICGLCPVLAECRDYALAAPTTLVGVWGGLSARERRDLRARLNRGEVA